MTPTLLTPERVADIEKRVSNWVDCPYDIAEDSYAKVANHLAQDRAALLSHIRAMEEEEKWRPIETAPKDGTEFLAWGTRNGGVDFDASKPMLTQCMFYKTGTGGWFIETVATPRYYAGFTPTHWMPLPEPPSD